MKTDAGHIPFASPDIGNEEIDRVVKCMQSGWLTSGTQMKIFEEDFKNFLGGNVETVAVNSATSGLFLAMEAFGIGAGDEVITTAYTFSATAMTVVHLGATPVLLDIDPDTMNIDIAQIEAAITDKTKAIIPVHFAGLACDMEAINAIARKHNLIVIEDAAHALPATSYGKMIGASTSDATIYSFYATKTITTGEGGMIATPHKEIAQRCITMRLHGISQDVFGRYTSKGASWHYEISAPGYKCNLTDMAASIGIEQLKKANSFLDKRRYIAEKYLQAFKDLPVILPPEAKNGDIHSWHLFVIRLKDSVKISREEFIQRMNSEYNIGCSVHFIPLCNHPFWKEKLSVTENDFPNSNKAYSKAVSLPIYTKMTDEQIARVIESVREILA